MIESAETAAEARDAGVLRELIATTTAMATAVAPTKSAPGSTAT